MPAGAEFTIMARCTNVEASGGRSKPRPIVVVRDGTIDAALRTRCPITKIAHAARDGLERRKNCS
jgi:hypothetical protein